MSLSIGELKEVIKDMPNDMFVVVESIISGEEKFSSDVVDYFKTYDNDAESNIFVLKPKEVAVVNDEYDEYKETFSIGEACDFPVGTVFKVKGTKKLMEVMSGNDLYGNTLYWKNGGYASVSISKNTKNYELLKYSFYDFKKYEYSAIIGAWSLEEAKKYYSDVVADINEEEDPDVIDLSSVLNILVSLDKDSDTINEIKKIFNDSIYKKEPYLALVDGSLL